MDAAADRLDRLDHPDQNLARLDRPDQNLARPDRPDQSQDRLGLLDPTVLDLPMDRPMADAAAVPSPTMADVEAAPSPKVAAASPMAVQAV